MTSAGVRKIQQQLEAEVNEVRGVQKDLGKHQQMLQQYLLQLNENEIVKQEFGHLSDGDAVFKLIGPALMKQDTEEAKANVDKRIEYISSELKRLEEVIRALNVTMTEKKEQVFRTQQQLQVAASHRT